MSRLILISLAACLLAAGGARADDPSPGAAPPDPRPAASRHAPLKSLPLAGPDAAGSSHGKLAATGGIASLVGSLALVLGLFLLVAWMLRRTAPKSSAALPREAVEVLGRAPLAARLYVHLVRCGNKMLLVSVTPGGAETLTEITDPVEVDRLAGLCEQNRTGSASSAFRQVFEQLGSQRAERTRTADRAPVAAGVLAGRRSAAGEHDA